MRLISIIMLTLTTLQLIACPPDHVMGAPDADKVLDRLKLGLDVAQPERTLYELVMNKELSMDEFESCYRLRPLKITGKVAEVSAFLDDGYRITGSNFVKQMGRGPCFRQDETCVFGPREPEILKKIKRKDLLGTANI